MEYQESFNYLDQSQIYLDSACQSLRPVQVVNSLNNYYYHHNSCGGRVRYKWGRETDEKVSSTRQKILDYLKLKNKDYKVSFTLNTTYGINLILNQLDPEISEIKQIVTSEVEHNSVFLSTINFAKKHQLPRLVLKRDEGKIDPVEIPDNSLFIVNCTSNIDGRELSNLSDLIKKVHKSNGLVIIDAAQAMAHNVELLHKTQADAICFSSHKMYGPSLGVIVFRKDFIKNIHPSFLGGGMVDDVSYDSFLLSNQNPDHMHTIFEPGLQAWGEIISLGSAIDWLNKLPKTAKQNLDLYSKELFNFLKNHPKAHLINSTHSPTISFYIDGVSSHLLGDALAEEGIMTRTGYFCVHYYLDHVLKTPTLIRLSLGFHNKKSDIDKTIEVLSRIK